MKHLTLFSLLISLLFISACDNDNGVSPNQSDISSSLVDMSSSSVEMYTVYTLTQEDKYNLRDMRNDTNITFLFYRDIAYSNYCTGDSIDSMSIWDPNYARVNIPGEIDDNNVAIDLICDISPHADTTGISTRDSIHIVIYNPYDTTDTTGNNILDTGNIAVYLNNSDDASFIFRVDVNEYGMYRYTIPVLDNENLSNSINEISQIKFRFFNDVDHTRTFSIEAIYLD